MKRILFLSLALSFYGSVNAQSIQLFTQDFSTSTTVADYVSASTPNIGQFNSLSASSVAPSTALVTTINNGALRFDRTATATAFAYRNYSFTTKPTFVQLKMDFQATNVGTYTAPLFSVLIGSSFTSSASGTTSAYLCRYGIYMQNTNGDFKVGSIDNVGGTAPTSSATFSGLQTITFVANNSGVDQTYTAPDASTETVVNGKMDVWVGTTKAINDFLLRGVTGAATGGTGPSPDITGFKIQSTSAAGTGIFDIDNVEFTDLLGTSTLSTSKFEKSVANITAYPNPTGGIFEINNLPLSLQTVKLGIYSLDSKLLQSKTYNVNNGTVKLDISGLAKGVYFVKGDSDNPLVAKVIKE